MEKQVVGLVETQEAETPEDRVYREPEVFFIGKAFDIVQGYNYGKRNDGYTGQYYE